MKLLKKIEDMKFTKVATDLFVSEPLAMASAAGWYVGTICKKYDHTPCFVEPYDRWTEYMTKEQAVEMLKEEWFIY